MSKKTQRDLIIESGLADRIVATLKVHKGLLDPKITFDRDECDFWVNLITDELSGEKYLQVVIEIPNLGPNRDKHPRITTAFGVQEENEYFGAYGERPLTKEQFELVQQLAAEESK